MNPPNFVNSLIRDIKERLTFDGRNRVFNEDKELRSDFMKERAEPEAFTREFLIDKIFSVLESDTSALQQQIDKTDQQIDNLVYELYGLTEEEVRVVEGE